MHFHPLTCMCTLICTLCLAPPWKASRNASCAMGCHVRLNLPPINFPGGINKSGLAGSSKGGIIWEGDYLTLLLCTRDGAKNIVPGVPEID